MTKFRKPLAVASALVLVPSTLAVAVPAANAAPVNALQTTNVKSKKKSAKKPGIRMQYLRTNKKAVSVSKYQTALRTYASKTGVNYRSLNPSGVTKFYGKETRNLTRAVTRTLATRDSSWVPRSRSNASVHPNKKFVAIIGLRVVTTTSKPATSSSSATAPNSAWPAISKVNATSQASTWRGPGLRHPRTGAYFSSNITKWANLVRAVMAEHRVPDKYLVGILAQIQQESGGQPNAVNDWDSNAQKGTPSKGLLQVILPTYKYYAKAGYKTSKYQMVPYTNIWAALNYVKARYGMSKFQSWNSGQNQGY